MGNGKAKLSPMGMSREPHRGKGVARQRWGLGPELWGHAGCPAAQGNRHWASPPTPPLGADRGWHIPGTHTHVNTHTHMHTGFLISQTTWSSSPEAAQRASPLPPRLARTIGWPGKHSGSSRGLRGPGGGQGPEHSPPSPGQGWPMARALEPSQPRCPGFSPPGSPRPLWLHPHRSCVWPPSHPNSASGSRPQPLMLCWAHRNTAGAYKAAGARRVLLGKPCLSGSQPTSFPLPLGKAA